MSHAAAYVKADVVPLAQRLVLDQRYLSTHMTPDQHRQYLKGLVRLGGALNELPRDFLTGISQQREDSVQSEIRGALSDLRAIMGKLPSSQTYLKVMDDLQNATTVDRIGVGVDTHSKMTQKG